MEIVKMPILSVTEGTALVELHLEECAAEFNCPGIAEMEVQRGPSIAERERCSAGSDAVQVQVLQRERCSACVAKINCCTSLICSLNLRFSFPRFSCTLHF